METSEYRARLTEELLKQSGNDPIELAKRVAKVEPTTVITVRLPRTFHEVLLKQAARLKVNEPRMSLNRLCVQLLAEDYLLPIAEQLIADAMIASPLGQPSVIDELDLTAVVAPRDPSEPQHAA